jgi:hypothetical protein
MSPRRLPQNELPRLPHRWDASLAPFQTSVAEDQYWHLSRHICKQEA